MSHHLIEFTRDCLPATGELSFYAPAAAAPVTPAAVTILREPAAAPASSYAASAA